MKELTSKQIKNLIKYIERSDVEKIKKRIQKDYKNYNMKPSVLGRIFEKIAMPDKNGYSRSVNIDELLEIHKDFKTSNGNQWARSNTSYLGAKYNVVRNQNEINNGKKYKGVSSIQLVGLNTNDIRKKRHIRTDIVDYFHNQKCAVLDVMSSSGMECDHKNGRYDTESNASLKTQKIEDFQSLSKAVNDAKRTHCSECKRNGGNNRYDAKRLGYAISDVHIENQPYCQGCYWNDPQEFNRIVSQNYLKIA